MQYPTQQGAQGVQVKMGIAGTFKDLAAFKIIGQADNSAFEAMITAKEVSKNIKEMSKNVAPGPDGLSLRDLIKMDPHSTQLMEHFCLWLVSGTRHGKRMLDCVNIKICFTRTPE